MMNRCRSFLLPEVRGKVCTVRLSFRCFDSAFFPLQNTEYASRRDTRGSDWSRTMRPYDHVAARTGGSAVRAF